MLKRWREWVHYRRKKGGRVTLAYDQRLILTIVIAIIFNTLYYRIDMAIVLGLIGVGLFESIWCLYADKMLEVSYEALTDCAEKDEAFRFKVSVKNRGYLPTPFIKILLNADDTIGFDKTALEFFVKARSTVEMEVTCKAQLSGQIPILWKGSTLYPPLTPIKREIGGTDKPMGSVGILPQITKECILQDDGAQEERFKLRQYRTGDGMRNINWKIYAKTDKLFVREKEMHDMSERQLALRKEGSDCTEKSVIMDCFVPKDTYYVQVDELLQRFISRVNTYVTQEIAVIAYFRTKEKWECCEVTEAESLEVLRTRIIQSVFVTERISAEHLITQLGIDGELISLDEVETREVQND